MNDDYKIYVDASRPATLNNGAGALTDCARTVREQQEKRSCRLSRQPLKIEQLHCDG